LLRCMSPLLAHRAPSLRAQFGSQSKVKRTRYDEFWGLASRCCRSRRRPVRSFGEDGGRC